MLYYCDNKILSDIINIVAFLHAFEQFTIDFKNIIIDD